MILKLFKISRQKLKVKSISVSINHNKTPGCHGRVVFCLPRLAEENAWGPAGDMDVFSSAYRPPGWPMVGQWLANGWPWLADCWPMVSQRLVNGWQIIWPVWPMVGQRLVNGWCLANVQRGPLAQHGRHPKVVAPEWCRRFFCFLRPTQGWTKNSLGTFFPMFAAV